MTAPFTQTPTRARKEHKGKVYPFNLWFDLYNKSYKSNHQVKDLMEVKQTLLAKANYIV